MTKPVLSSIATVYGERHRHLSSGVWVFLEYAADLHQVRYERSNRSSLTKGSSNKKAQHSYRNPAPDDVLLCVPMEDGHVSCMNQLRPLNASSEPKETKMWHP